MAPLLAVILTNCVSQIPAAPTDQSTRALETACLALVDKSKAPWYWYEGWDLGLDNLWRGYRELHQDEENRSIVIFIDGTGNTDSSITNIWKLYTLAAQQGCTNAIIPFYQAGVGVRPGNRLLGNLFGGGVNRYIQRSYQVLAQTYKPGDKIFIFGFSRGAYIARSLNGMIEFAGLLQVDEGTNQKNEIGEQTSRLFTAYHLLNDGKPNFEQRLYGIIEDEVGDIHVYRGTDKVKVEAIGVFDTVPALGIGRDDNPDNHRTDLYANHGFHALSIDEQRNDFRPLMFSHLHEEAQKLSQIWFAGAHSDVGGGYPDSDLNPHSDLGLQKLSRDWMLQNFQDYGLFSDVAYPPACGEQDDICEAGHLHDAFLDNYEAFGRLGIHWRMPARKDTMHGSVLCRYEISRLPLPHKKREPKGQYRPENLIYPLSENYKFTDFACSGTESASAQ